MKGEALRVAGTVFLSGALLLSGCGLIPQSGQGVETPPTPTLAVVEPTPEAVDPTPTAPAPPEPETPTTVVVEIPDWGLSFEVPSDWTHLEPEWRWAPEAGSELGVGVHWMTLEPPQEPEAVMLPAPSEVVSSEPVELSFGAGRWVVLNVFAAGGEGEEEVGPIASVEAHVLVVVSRGGVRQAYGFFASAPDHDGLEMLEPVLKQMVETAILESVEDDVTEVIRAEVAQELDVPVEGIALGELVPVEWPDACLGLPAEGEMCATVITPGYSVTAMVNGQPYEVRANTEGTVVRLEPETPDAPDVPVVPELPDTSALPEAVRSALSILARHLNISESAISVVSYEAVEWSTACLGIDRPGLMCATVITPGYRVVLSVEGVSFQLHTNQSGTSVGIVP
jgi:hypothetical protein